MKSLAMSRASRGVMFKVSCIFANVRILFADSEISNLRFINFNLTIYLTFFPYVLLVLNYI